MSGVSETEIHEEETNSFEQMILTAIYFWLGSNPQAVWIRSGNIQHCEEANLISLLAPLQSQVNILLFMLELLLSNIL